ncbi:hypothetical protein ERJ75_001483200 [Trypanosoma vivax]|nr:hypothetical protein ERJ75_001483200 [Trypanosoma vivax]
MAGLTADRVSSAADLAVALRRATALEATVEAAALVAALLDACSCLRAAAATVRVRLRGRRRARVQVSCADNCVVCAVTRECVRCLVWNLLSILWHAAVFQDEAQPQRRGGDASSVPRAQLLHCDARVP